MCTAVTYQTKDFYFGRNLDLYYSYQEEVTITPRRFPFSFRNGSILTEHYAMVGMATVAQDYPLYYEATNEKGLSLAGLNFPGNAVYHPYTVEKDNIAPYELIPWILGQCANCSEAVTLLKNLCLWNHPFSDSIPLTPLHWMLADRERCIVIEPTAEELVLAENAFGVLTNNPPFDFHRQNIIRYLNLTPKEPDNRFFQDLDLRPFSLGMGSIGLPGDPSSPSRFVRAAYTKLNSRSGSGEKESISQFFQILGSVAQQRGITGVEGGKYEFTLYSSCCNTDRGIYYYTTYENSRITGIDMFREELDRDKLVRYPLRKGQDILMER